MPLPLPAAVTSHAFSGTLSNCTIKISLHRLLAIPLHVVLFATVCYLLFFAALATLVCLLLATFVSPVDWTVIVLCVNSLIMHFQGFCLQLIEWSFQAVWYWLPVLRVFKKHSSHLNCAIWKNKANYSLIPKHKILQRLLSNKKP